MQALIGREQERDELEAALAAGHRIITLLGPAGVGKTRLAQELCGADGGFCDLTEACTGDQLEAALAALKLGETVRLVVLDGVERVLDRLARKLGQLSVQAPVLLTSRERLRLQDERVVVIEPLALPRRGASDDELHANAAVQLLRQAGRAAGADEAEASNEQLAAIARAVDGLPLALILAATRLRALGVQQLLRELDEPLTALGKGLRDAPIHHRSLEGAIGRSWQLLSAAEKQALSRLCAWLGSLDVERAQQLLALPRAAALDMLEALCDKSLLQPSSGRYRMLSLIRAFAQQHAPKDAGYLISRAESLFRLGRCDESVACLDGISSTDRGEQQQIAELRGSVLRRLGRFEEARQSLEPLLELAEGGRRLRVQGALATVALEQGDLDAACQGLQSVRAGAGSDARSYAMATGMLGHALQELGELDDAADAYDEATSCFEALGDARLAAAYRGYRATLAHERGDDDAEIRYQHVLASMESHGAHFAAMLWACLGSLRAWRGDELAARDAFERADSLAGSYHDPAVQQAVAIHQSWLVNVVHDESITSDDVRFARRMRERGAEAVVRLGRGWFEVGSRRIDLGRRKVLWRLLLSLAERASPTGDAIVTREQLIAEAWQGERILPKAASHRLRVAIHTLRREGLSQWLVRSESGYGLVCLVDFDEELMRV